MVRNRIELESHKFLFIDSQAIVMRLPQRALIRLPLCQSRNISKLTQEKLECESTPEKGFANEMDSVGKYEKKSSAIENCIRHAPVR